MFRRARSPRARFRIYFFFLFFEKIRRRRLKLFFLSLLEGRKSTGKGTLLLLPKKRISVQRVGDVLEMVQRPSNARKRTSRDVFSLVRAVFG